MTKTQTKSNADAATEFALHNRLDIVSDLYAGRFVVYSAEYKEYRVVKITGRTKGGFTIGGRAYVDKGSALAAVKHNARLSQPDEMLMSVPDQAVIDRYCAMHGVKASNNSHNGYIVVSKPVKDNLREWKVAKRVGNTLEVAATPFKDRWQAYAEVVKSGGPKATQMLGGPFMFPYGNSWRTAPNNTKREDQAA